MRRALAPLALLSAALLAGCGGTGSAGGSTTSGGSPGVSADGAGSVAATPAASSPAPASDAPPTSAPPTSTAPTSAAPSSAPPTTTPTSDGGSTSSPAVRTYRHLSLTLPVADDALPDAPAGLTAYLRGLLQKDWKELGHTRECRSSGVVELRATRADGFAYGTHEINVTPDGGCEKAATMGGGYRAVWKSVNGTWQQVLAMQDVPDCTQFEKWDVPSAILGKDAQCYDGSDVVVYHHA